MHNVIVRCHLRLGKPVRQHLRKKQSLSRASCVLPIRRHFAVDWERYDEPDYDDPVYSEPAFRKVRKLAETASLEQLEKDVDFFTKLKSKADKDWSEHVTDINAPWTDGHLIAVRKNRLAEELSSAINRRSLKKGDLLLERLNR